MKKNVTRTIITIALIAFLVMIILWRENLNYEPINCVIGLVGALAIWIELKRSKEISEGEFIVGINDSFLNNDDIKEIYKKLQTNQPIEDEEVVAVVEYLTFFESLFLLVNKKVINMSIVDDLFSYRFFLAVNNKDIQRISLLPYAKSYRNIYTLDYMWKKFRKKNHKEVYTENMLSSVNPQYMTYVKKKGQ